MAFKLTKCTGNWVRGGMPLCSTPSNTTFAAIAFKRNGNHLLTYAYSVQQTQLRSEVNFLSDANNIFFSVSFFLRNPLCHGVQSIFRQVDSSSVSPESLKNSHPIPLANRFCLAFSQFACLPACCGLRIGTCMYKCSSRR